jgi:hypothetical protein
MFFSRESLQFVSDLIYMLARQTVQKLSTRNYLSCRNVVTYSPFQPAIQSWRSIRSSISVVNCGALQMSI